MRKPIVTLTTDFGTRDHFVGVMKGVILSICPEAAIVDISHEVEPFGIAQGAFLIAQAYRYFPAETAHVIVVDPGVGSARRPILVEAADQFFIAPDNGVLGFVYSQSDHKVRELTCTEFFLHPVSQTFHGRDVFSPVAAHLVNGARPSSFGKTIEDALKPSFAQPERVAKQRWRGAVLHVDRFGNLITNLHIDAFSEVRARPFEFAIGARKLTHLGSNYADVKPGAPFVIVGSSGYLEVAANQGSAAHILGCAAGSACELTLI
jgi:S-adenosylmethionine hydrolase